MRKNSIKEEKINKKITVMENITDKGTVKFNNTVLSSIVKTAACQTPGVIRISSGSNNLFENLTHLMIGRSKTRENAIKIDISEKNINITIKIIAEYGKNIPQLANDVQLNIIQKIKELTGLEASKVDVIVNGLEEYEKEVKEQL